MQGPLLLKLGKSRFLPLLCKQVSISVLKGEKEITERE